MAARSSSNKLSLGETYLGVEAGRNLVRFINGIDMAETNIGETRQDHIDNRKYFVVSGYIIEKGAAPVDILTAVEKYKVRSDPKFSNFGGITPQTVLRQYTESAGFPKEAFTLALDQFAKINSNKILPIPFRPGTQCKIAHKDFKGLAQTTLTEIDEIKWIPDNSPEMGGKLVGTIICEVKVTDDGKKCAKAFLRDYGRTWTVPSLEGGLKAAEITRDAINMTDLGFILPIVASDDVNTVAIDGYHMYSISKGYSYIVGTFTEKGLVEDKELVSKIKGSKAYEYIKKIEKFVERHSRYILPYGLCEPYRVDLGKGKGKGVKNK